MATFSPDPLSVRHLGGGAGPRQGPWVILVEWWQLREGVAIETCSGLPVYIYQSSAALTAVDTRPQKATLADRLVPDCTLAGMQAGVSMSLNRTVVFFLPFFFFPASACCVNRNGKLLSLLFFSFHCWHHGSFDGLCSECWTSHPVL